MSTKYYKKAYNNLISAELIAILKVYYPDFPFQKASKKELLKIGLEIYFKQTENEVLSDTNTEFNFEKDDNKVITCIKEHQVVETHT